MDRRGRLLIVDDDLDILGVMEGMLAEAGYEVQVALSGEVALRLVAQQRWDVLLTDYRMPAMDGLKLIEKSLQVQSDLGCILVTGFSDLDTVVDAMRVGASNYLLKPVDKDILIFSVEKCLLQVRLNRENKKYQENLARVNQLLIREMNEKTLILNAAGEGIVGLDRKGCVTFANRAADLMLGWSADFLVGKSLHVLTQHAKPDGTPFPGDRCPICAFNSSSTWYHGRALFTNRSGTRFPVSYVSTPVIKDDAAIASVVVFKDITAQQQNEEKIRMYQNHLEEMINLRTAELEETNRQLQKDIAARKRAEKEAEQRRQQLIEADKMISLGILVAGVAHEINNPNNFIMMNTPLLKRVWEDVTPVLDRYFKEEGDFQVGGLPYSEMQNHVHSLFSGLEEGAQRIKRIVLNLKDYARQDISDLSQDVDINEVLKAALTIIANLLKRSTHHLTVDYGEQIPTFKGNFQRIEQVVINVVQNACQSLSDPSKAITISTTHDPERNLVQLVVRDEGGGIPRKDLKRITDPFFTTKRNIGGTGLGLSISVGIIEEHGGKILFESEVGKGTMVTLALPC